VNPKSLRASAGRHLRDTGVLLAWIGVILLLVMPWRNPQDLPQWQRVGWIPFLSSPIKVVDIVANVLLYVPFGYLCARHEEQRVWWILLYALALSLACEGAQLFSLSRFPSATDVACNVTGAWLGTMRTRRQRTP
jgi:glycopeptide antibiotics resistance protein